MNNLDYIIFVTIKIGPFKITMEENAVLDC